MVLGLSLSEEVAVGEHPGLRLRLLEMLPFVPIDVLSAETSRWLGVDDTNDDSVMLLLL